jgi:response regulator RpfG family c-di-GMP phosphodiesterase
MSTDVSNDTVTFYDEEAEAYQGSLSTPWKILIADDEEEVHAVTRMVLSGFTFENRHLHLLGAYSGEETREMLRQHPDLAVILLDVVMEEDDAGLAVVKFIREELRNSFIRIILRTGQPGQAPERRVTMEYDINDYKEKTELTAQKLFTTITSALRAYRDLRTIERNKKGLEHIVAASANLFELRSLGQFATGALEQLTALLHFDENSLYVQSSGLAISRQQGDFYVLAATGEFAGYVNLQVKAAVPEPVQRLLFQAIDQKRSLFTEHVYVGYFCTKQGSENVIYLQGRYDLNAIERGLIRTFSTNIAVAFDNIYLNQEIEEAQKEVIYTLGEVVETRSQETGQHVKRVGAYCHFLALKYGLDQATADLLRLAAPMHDVGKIGIPDAILNKPGKLTNEEFEIIKTHTTIGYRILKGSKEKILQTAATIALQHHERWDGQGYPHGLKGADINILARITKLADIFDALSFRRVYNEAWNMDLIIELFKDDHGRHFDPTLVRLFLENLNEILAIKNSYPNES